MFSKGARLRLAGSGHSGWQRGAREQPCRRWEIAVEDGEYLSSTRSVSPVAHQFADDGEVG